MRGEQQLGAAVHWLLSLCAIALATGLESSAAFADQPHPLPSPKHQTIPASSLPVSAQREKERDSAPQIFVTGSRIPRINLTAVSPVTMIKSDEIKLEGTTNVEEVLNQLPQVSPSQGEFVSAGATGTATVDLRGLGPARTLVLVDGQRLMPGDPRFPVADINSIPTSLIQRVEVLTGGAAAVYGSDAVAGVVNFILDTKLDGLRIEGEISAYQHNNHDKFVQGLLDRRQIPYPRGSVFDGRRENMSVAFGHDFFDSRAHVTLYAGYRRIAGLTQDRRDYSACAITAVIVRQKPTSTLECGGAILAYPGNFFDNLGHTYQVTTDRTFVQGLGRYNFAPWNFYQRPDKRITAGGFGDFELSSAARAYVEVMDMNDRSLAQTSPSGDATNTETINCDNPLLSNQQRSLICRAGNFVGEIPIFDDNGNLAGVFGSPTRFVDPATGATFSRGWLLIARRNVEGGPIQDDLRHRSVRLLGGFKGDLGSGVTYGASYLFGRVTLNRHERNVLSITRLGRALDVVTDPSSGQPVCRSALIARQLGPSAPGADSSCVPWDIFATGQVTPQSTAYLTIPLAMRGWFAQRIGNVNATVQLDRWGIRSPLSDDSPSINLGVEDRNDSVDFKPDESAQSGDIAGFSEQVFPIRGSISTKEIFGEARIPLLTDKLVRRLAFEGGFRKSWYRKGARKFSTSAYKLALDLTVVTGLRLRTSQQRANRAPNVQELFAPIQPDFFARDPCAGTAPQASQAQCALTGVTPTQYGRILDLNTSLLGYNAIMGGNADLQPETATTRTIGIVFEPRFLSGFNATVDWWDINLRGAIAQIGAQSIIDACVATGDSNFCNRIHRDPNGSLWLGNGHVDNRQANIGGLRTRGIDVGADYSVRLGRMGSANLEFRGSYVLKSIVNKGGLSTPYDCAGLFGDPCGMQPRWRHEARVTWTAPPGISLSLRWRHMGDLRLAALDPKFNLTNNVSPADAELKAQDYFDLTTVLRVRQRFELRVGVRNLFDRQPPLIVRNTAAGGGPVNGNTYPEWYDALGRYVFASATMNFKR
ncbi:MAG: TonB-dependent receptor domain-containing protein [Sphingomicrobium sp.]